LTLHPSLEEPKEHIILKKDSCIFSVAEKFEGDRQMLHPKSKRPLELLPRSIVNAMWMRYGNDFHAVAEKSKVARVLLGVNLHEAFKEPGQQLTNIISGK
jgi:hypothetical protein